MKLLLTTLVIIISVSSYSQQNEIYKRKPWEDAKKGFDYKKLQNLKSQGEIKVEDFQYKMPVLKLDIKINLSENTGKGLLIYSLSPDHILCLAPDANFKSNMPVAGFIKPVELEQNKDYK